MTVTVSTNDLRSMGLSRKMAAECRSRDFENLDEARLRVAAILNEDKNKERREVAVKQLIDLRSKAIAVIPQRKSIDFLDFRSAACILAEDSPGALKILQKFENYADAITLLGVLSRKFNWRGWEIMVAYDILGHKMETLADFIRDPVENDWRRIEAVVNNKRKTL